MSLLVAAWDTSVYRRWNQETWHTWRYVYSMLYRKYGWFLTAFTAMRQTMFCDAQSQLKSAEILPGCRYQKGRAVILRELLKESISYDDYHKLSDFVTRHKLLETNIVAFHSNPREITFQSTVMKRFCEENSALWERKWSLLHVTTRKTLGNHVVYSKNKEMAGRDRQLHTVVGTTWS